MENIIPFLNENIDKLLFVIIILSGIFITKYTEQIKLSNVYKVLIASVIFSSIFYIINDCKQDCLNRYLLTYLLATSFYEVFVKWIFDHFGTNDKSNRTADADTIGTRPKGR